MGDLSSMIPDREEEMEILLSGLDEDACRETVGGRLWAEASIRWCAPDELLEAFADKVEPSDRRVIWFYRSPWVIADASLADSGSLDVVLDRWLTRNRTALSLRRQLGENLFLVNAGNVSIAALREELGGAGSAGGDLPASSAAVDAQYRDSGREVIIRHLFEWMAPRHYEVFESLDAASWLPESEPQFGIAAAPSEKHLIKFMEALRSDVVPAVPSGGRSDQQSGNGLKQENDLLLLQLHQVQEELEQYYLKNIELNRLVAAEKESFADLERNNQALKLQLQQMQRELLAADLAVGQGASGQQLTRGFTRFLPGRLRARLERSKANKLLEATLNSIRESKWFDRQWYFETYPDVRSAGMDPVEHYYNFGWKEGRSPSAGFDTEYYLRANPDVANSGLNPLLHFIEYGCKEGRLPRQP